MSSSESEDMCPRAVLRLSLARLLALCSLSPPCADPGLIDRVFYGLGFPPNEDDDSYKIIKKGLSTFDRLPYNLQPSVSNFLFLNADVESGVEGWA
jgi:hypothetical protein